MVKQIQNVVLFYSKYSKESIPCVEIIIKNGLPIQIIPLDSIKSRNIVTSSTSIQIRSVPSLLVEYTDSTIQLFVGRQKIIEWIEIITTQRSSPTPTHNYEKEQEPEFIEKDLSHKKKKKKRSKTPRHQLDVETPISLILEDAPRPTKPPALSTRGLETTRPPTEKNSDVMNIARRMRAERDASLKYKGEGEF